MPHLTLTSDTVAAKTGGVMTALLWLLQSSAAFACGTDESFYFGCTFGNGARAVEICHDAGIARYAFGPAGSLDDLRIQTPVTKVHLTPWPGIGRTIWEELIFQNAGHSYTIFTSIERHFPQDENTEITTTQSGGIIVRKGDTELAELTCDEGSVNFPWGTELFDAKVAKGQCYDQGQNLWQGC